MLSREIRQSFIDYFVERGHEHHPSAPLVPHGDPSLLFTNAGMVQFKNYFLGLERPPSPRAVTAQKCLRVSGKHNDLENVGPSPRHHTFFEMLGNFSFGDYFKEEAIGYGWELVTKVWGLPPERLFATVYEEDDEAHELWLAISGLPPERVLRCGQEDNFWAMGETGPCGPCSEIFVDLEPDHSPVPWEEGTESGRYLEIWNLVFMQFDRQAGGELVPLPRPSVDTGSGLERVAAVLQGVDSNYHTDLFMPILGAAGRAAGVAYGGDPQDDTSLRVIADHLRAVAFLLADGVVPGNEGRGYVLRRLLRRAVRHGMRLGLEEPFLNRLLPVLGEVVADAYPELSATQEASAATIRGEEEKFLATVATGARQVQDAIEDLRAEGGDQLSGEVVFRLYDTYGLPLDMIREIAEEEQVGVDDEGFTAALEEQRRRSRAGKSDAQGRLVALREALAGEGDLVETELVGYEELVLEGARVLRLARLLDDGAASAVSRLAAGESGVLIVDRTPFYAEAGGQVGDTGLVIWSGGRARVRDCQRDAGVALHFVHVEEDELEVGARITLEVSRDSRRQTERHHTATHLLHASLRESLGPGVRQAGSLVHPERLRFDFTHGQPLSGAQLDEIEERVNEWVRRAVPVRIDWQDYDAAVSRGAMALFGEKYGDRVRTVQVPGFSLELCGGCHVRNSGEIGSFVLTGERGVASGVRRVEALAGPLADEHLRRQRHLLAAVEAELGAPAGQLLDELVALKSKLREQERELSQLRMKLLSGETGAGERRIEVEGVTVLTRQVPPAQAHELRNLADVLRGRLGSGVVVLGTCSDDRVSLVAAVTDDLRGRIDAGRLARRMGDIVGGSGGGRADFAQAGGRDPRRLDEALAAVPAVVEEQLGGGAS
jgi:alanyl-tRNA synthetase